jgi:DUF438 domain-containing protein
MEPAMAAPAELKQILDRLESEPGEEARAAARAFLEAHDEQELVVMEEALLAGGMPAERMKLLCRHHLGATEGVSGPFRKSLPDGHVLATFMDEHQRILEKLRRLAELAAPEQRGNEGADDRAAIEEMRDLGAHLIGAEPHHQREEEVLFPALIERGVHGPPMMMEAEHVELRKFKHIVRDTAAAMLTGEGGEWRTLRSAALGLSEMLTAHIAKEDSILYPLAFQAIGDPETWADMKRRCDEIGYCCTAHA